MSPSGRLHSRLSQWNCERWPDQAVRRAVAALRSQYFPRPGPDARPGRTQSGGETGVPLNEAIRQILKQAQDVPPETEIIFEAKCRLAGENANGVRGVLTLARPLPRDTCILALCPEAQWEQAKAAGARYVGGVQLVPEILEGRLRFDRCLATLDQMPILAKIARVLGPQGLMPNAKTGTLTTDIVSAIQAALRNTPFKIEREGALLRLPVALAAFPEADLHANLRAVMDYAATQNRTTEEGHFVEAAQLILGDQRAVVPIARNEYAQQQGPRFLAVLQKHRAQVAARLATVAP